MTARKTASRRAKDAISLLTEDHKKVQKMFKQFEKLGEDDQERKAEIVEQACTELTIHATVEEEVFYPAMREVIEDKEVMDEAEVEHTTAKELISQLKTMKPGDDLFDAKFTVLGEYVNHHIKEEQSQMFPQAKTSEIDLVALGEEILARKKECQREMGMAEEQAEEEPEEEREER